MTTVTTERTRRYHSMTFFSPLAYVYDNSQFRLLLCLVLCLLVSCAACFSVFLTDSGNTSSFLATQCALMDATTCKKNKASSRIRVNEEGKGKNKSAKKVQKKMCSVQYLLQVLNTRPFVAHPRLRGSSTPSSS